MVDHGQKTFRNHPMRLSAKVLAHLGIHVTVTLLPVLVEMMKALDARANAQRGARDELVAAVEAEPFHADAYTKLAAAKAAQQTTTTNPTSKEHQMTNSIRSLAIELRSFQRLG